MPNAYCLENCFGLRFWHLEFLLYLGVLCVLRGENIFSLIFQRDRLID
jgi:hypothetical protein